MSAHESEYSEEEMESEQDKEFGLSIISLVGPSNHDCGYCKGKDTSISFGIWAHSLSCNDYQSLIDRGWRRSGAYLYKPDLEKSCCPQYTIRLDTTRFNTSKSQKKIINKFNRFVHGSWAPQSKEEDNKPETKPPRKPINYVQVKSLRDLIHEPETDDEGKHELKIELEPSSFTKEKYDLYSKYQQSIHNDKEDDISERGFKRFLVDSPMTIEEDQESGIKYGSYHQKYLLDGKLIALAVIDILPKCISSVYFIYDPDYSFLGLGKYSVFREISLTQEYYERSSKLQYYYMGFYIDSCPKMNYKGQYLPSDLLDPLDYSWHPIQDFKKEFQKGTTFASFSSEATKTRDYPSGWLDPKSVKDADLETVYVLLNERAIPLSFFISLTNSKSLKKSLVDYVCSVGLELAHKIIIAL